MKQFKILLKGALRLALVLLVLLFLIPFAPLILLLMIVDLLFMFGGEDPSPIRKFLDRLIDKII